MSRGHKTDMRSDFETWLSQVRAALNSINMTLDEWQRSWPFDFRAEFSAGTSAQNASAKANRYWWHEQNRAIGQHCRLNPNCWLPQGHQGKCQPVE